MCVEFLPVKRKRDVILNYAKTFLGFPLSLPLLALTHPLGWFWQGITLALTLGAFYTLIDLIVRKTQKFR